MGIFDLITMHQVYFFQIMRVATHDTLNVPAVLIAFDAEFLFTSGTMLPSGHYNLASC